MPERDDRQDLASRVLYHLGKGLWRSIPVLGPLMEELLYEQFRDQFLGGAGNLSEEDLQRILGLIPEGATQAELDESLQRVSDDIREFASHQLQAVMLSIQQARLESRGSIEAVNDNVKRIPIIEEILEDIRSKIVDPESLRLALQVIEQRRRAWVARISRNQVSFLKRIPEADTPVDRLWPICREVVPTCVYKEFRFRLHELEWLGLVERCWRADSTPATWTYRRTAIGAERVARDEGEENGRVD